MSTLNAATLLAAWDEGLAQSALQRALTLLATAWPDKSPEEWSHTSIGRRDANLLALREELFGAKLEATVVCSKCGEPLELIFNTHEIQAATPPFTVTHNKHKVEVGGYTVQYRLPTSADLLAIAQINTGNGREMLFERCVLAVQHGATTVNSKLLPDDVVKAVIAEMAIADPQADVQVALACPVCQHQWSMVFDILSYLWSEIDDWAHRLLREIHALASAYGWSERDILAMSAQRRRHYIEMLGA